MARVVPPPDTRLPDGALVQFDEAVVVGDRGRTLVGGDPVRVVYLAAAAHELLGGDRHLRVTGPRSAALARRLIDGGLAHPVARAADLSACGWTSSQVTGPPLCHSADRSAGGPGVADVTAVIPVRDRPLALGRLLAALPAQLAVVVVDDGSVDPDQTAATARSRDAVLVRHETARGPAAARNSGLRRVRTPLVAFVDSDVVPEPGWLEELLVQLVDPAVALVAPRVVALGAGGADGGRGGWLASYERVRSSLDLGPRPARVRPRGRVSYVPSACLLGRVGALGAGFDEALHVAEDVDLVWRLDAAGWRVRYSPTALVGHEHRVSARGWLARKAYYGTGAAPLATRHGRAVAPVAMPLWSALACLALLAQRRWSLPAAAVASAVATERLTRRLHASEHPLRTASRLVACGCGAAVRQAADALTRHWWPAAAILAVPSRRVRRAVLAAAVVGGLDDWRRDRPGLDPLRYLVARRLDDLAYGSGVWWGALRAGSLAALRPDLSGRPLDP